MKTNRDITLVILGKNSEDTCLLNELDKLIHIYSRSTSDEATDSFYRLFPTLSELRTRLMMESDY